MELWSCDQPVAQRRHRKPGTGVPGKMPGSASPFRDDTRANSAIQWHNRFMSTLATATREITIAHSPDSDDAFMFYGLATNKVQVPGLRFSHTLCDIQTLNQKAMEDEGLYDVTAVSFHAYPYIQQRYALMTCGGSVGEGYG